MSFESFFDFSGCLFFFSSSRRHTRSLCDWSSDVCSSDLPNSCAITSSQLRAVIAHEFGHYAGGDLKLGGWIYKTRGAMGRTIKNLARTGSWVHRPFLAYGNFFMRVTQAIARAQEIAADRIAVRVAGARIRGNALRP